jgi:diguanylate cyclase (GGDEF)-like protein
VLFVDLDDFKAVNDALGHAAGDELLRTIGERLRTRFRAVDTVARLGGDEFAVLVEDVSDVIDAHDRCEEVLAIVHEPVYVDGRELLMHASVGLAAVALGELDDRDGVQLLADADLAMYSAKLAGKRVWRSFEPSMRSVAADRSEIREALRSGVTEGAVELYYQPVVDLATGRTVSLEALVRWRHPVRGLLSPTQFLAIAEETGASIEFGRQVRETIAGHRQAWLDGGKPMAGLPIAVNVSARELLEPTLVDRFAELMEAGSFPAGHLMVEVAEPAIETDVDRARATIHALHELGVDLVLDDFGADRASINHLSHLQADYLKLEPRLVAELVQIGADDRLLRAVVALCAELGIDPIAEGIEDPHQAERIKRLGVVLGQGYLFSRPVPPEALSRLWDRPPIVVD